MPIWKKSKPTKRASEPKPSTPAPPESAAESAVPPVAGNLFCLVKGCKLNGELAASADVEIQGRVEGKIELDDSDLIVAGGGSVIADIVAREVVVRGAVVGNVSASRKIVVESSGSVLGDICAPSIELADGSSFTGSINRDSAPAKVTGRLSGGTDPPPKPRREKSQALMRRRNSTDRRGHERPWGAASNRRASRPGPEPTTTA